VNKEELVNGFKAASWKSQDEIRAFIEKNKDATFEHVTGILEVLMDKKGNLDSMEHRTQVRVFRDIALNVADKRLFESYMKALKTNDKNLRAALVELFPVVNNPSMHPRLCDVLRSSDAQLRKTVSQVLQKIGNPRVAKKVIDMVSERNFPGKGEVIDIAGVIASKDSLEFFGNIITLGTPVEKMRVLNYLGSPAYRELDHEAVVDTIRYSLHDKDLNTLERGILALANASTEEEYFTYAGHFLNDTNAKLVQTTIRGLRNFSGGHTMAALERKIFIGPNMIRMTVLETVENIAHDNVLKPLIKTLEHRQESVKVRGREVLLKLVIGEKIDLARTIIWLLKSDHEDVRQMAKTVAETKKEKTDELLSGVLERLKGESWLVRQAVLKPLIALGGKGLTPHVLGYLSETLETFRLYALDMLMGLKDPASLEGLLKTAQNDENWLVKEKAIKVIAAINEPKTAQHLLDIGMKDSTLLVVVLESLRNMEAKSFASYIASFLEMEDPDVRLAALKCLEAFEDSTYSQNILPLTRDNYREVNTLAKELAAKWNVTQDEKVISVSLSYMDKLLIAMNKAEADDLILLPDNTPYIKRRGRTIPMTNTPLSAQQIYGIVKPILTEPQIESIRKLRDVDFSYEVRAEGLRFRANIFVSHTGISIVLRIIKGDVFKLEDLGLPPVVKEFGDYKHGLVLVGGPTGSGKSTTLAAIIDYINRTSKRHVISIEDPIESIHGSELGLVNQREVGVHTGSYHNALRMTLREDPDVILVGEMRDLETIQFTVTAAETGHLVFGTVHTVSADTSVDRLTNAYPPEAQEQVRSMLADSLKAVLCQYLMRQKDKKGMVLATEVMINTEAISNLIRKGKTHQIPSLVSLSREQQMHTMDNTLIDLYKKGTISLEDAYLKARNKAEFEELAGITEAPAEDAPPQQAKGKG
jgi:twitching motility protein PilT